MQLVSILSQNLIITVIKIKDLAVLNCNPEIPKTDYLFVYFNGAES